MQGLAFVGRSLARALRNFRRDHCLDQAAVVAFYSLLSLGPLIYLAGVLLRALFRGTEPMQQALLRLSPFLPPEAASALAGLIEGELDLHRGLVLVALPALLWVASSGFHALERAINVAYATRRRSQAVRARLKSFAVMMGSLSFLGASLLLHAVLLRFDRLRESLELPSAPTSVGTAISHAILLAIAFGGFAICFRTLPRCPSTWSSAFGGAALALPLWDAARLLFGALLQRSPAFGLLTGTMSAIVAFQLWIYTSVAVGLLGAEFAAVLAGRRS